MLFAKKTSYAQPKVLLSWTQIKLDFNLYNINFEMSQGQLCDIVSAIIQINLILRIVE